MAGKFSASIRGFSEKSGIKLDAVLRSVLGEIVGKLVDKSPVGNRELWASNNADKIEWREAHPVYLTGAKAGQPRNRLQPAGYVGGRFKSNWQIGEGSAPVGELWDKKAERYPDANETLGRLELTYLTAKFGNNYWIVNNLPYAYRLETGWSQQAPTGMVATTMAEAQGMVDRAVDATRSR